MIFRSILRAGAVALALSVAAGASGARAQQKAQPPAQPPMVLPVITPSHLAMARAVVISSGLSRSFNTIVPELMGEMYANITQTRPELAGDLKTVLQQLQPEFEKQTSQLIDVAATAVAGQIDETDLKQIDTFFSSPAGKKYVNAEPEMLEHMMTSVHQLTEQMSQEMLTRVREELKKRGKTL